MKELKIRSQEEVDQIRDVVFNFYKKFERFKNLVDSMYKNSKLSEEEYSRLKNLTILDSVNSSLRELNEAALTDEERKFLELNCDITAKGDIINVKYEYRDAEITTAKIVENVRGAFYLDHLTFEERRNLLKVIYQNEILEKLNEVESEIKEKEDATTRKEILTIDFKYSELQEMRRNYRAELDRVAAGVESISNTEVKRLLFKEFSIKKRYYDWYMLSYTREKFANGKVAFTNSRNAETMTILTSELDKKNEEVLAVKEQRLVLEQSYDELFKDIFGYDLDSKNKDYVALRNLRLNKTKDKKLFDRAKTTIRNLEEEKMMRKHRNNLLSLFEYFVSTYKVLSDYLKNDLGIKINNFDLEEGFEAYLKSVYDVREFVISPRCFLQDLFAAVMDYYLNVKSTMDVEINKKEAEVKELLVQIKKIAEVIRHDSYDFERMMDVIKSNRQVSIGLSLDEEEKLFNEITEAINNDIAQNNETLKFTI